MASLLESNTEIAAVPNATPEGKVSVTPRVQSISYDAANSSKKNPQVPTVTTAASTALFNAVIRDHDSGFINKKIGRTVVLIEVRALLASGLRLTNAEIASIKGMITHLKETASKETAGGDHGWAWETDAEAKLLQEGLDICLHSAAAASDYKINQSKSTSLGEWKKEVEKNKQKLNDGSSESKPQSKEASKCGPAPAPGKSSPLESNTTAQANLEQKILAAKNAYREAEDIDPTSSDNDALKSIWIALSADLKKLQSNELAIAADLVKVMKTLIYANGDTYIGKISEGDEKKGKGRFTCESGAKKGSIYEGEFQLNKMHGHGTFTFISGSMYSGGMTDSQKNGYGIFTLAKNNQGSWSKYVGEFKNNQRYGIGTMTWFGTHVGQKYVGEWKNDRYDGQGTLESAISTIHSGEWVNGEPKK